MQPHQPSSASLPESRTGTLILGAGMTGLAYANFAKGDYLVLERDAEPGGYCKTVVQDGFVWDYSGHFFHFRHPDVEAWMRERMPDDEILTVVKSSGIWFEGVRIDFPFQKNIHQLPLNHFLACLHDLYFLEARDEVTFEDMLIARFGRGIADRFLIPYNEKLYACPMNRLDKDAMGRFFPHADVGSIIRNFVSPDNGGYNASFTYPRGGAIRYVHALLHDLPPERLAYSEPVIAIDPAAHVATTPKRRIHYDRLVSSLPFNRLLQVSGIAHEPSVYSWNKVLVFNLGFDRKGQTRDHWLYVPSRDVVFYRVGFYDNIFGDDKMSLYVEIGLPQDAEVPSDPREIDARWLDRVLIDLAAIGVTDGHQLASHHSVVLDPAYVHINRAARSDFERQTGLLREHDIHSAGRYGGWTYCSIEDNIVEARALAQRLEAPHEPG